MHSSLTPIDLMLTLEVSVNWVWVCSNTFHVLLNKLGNLRCNHVWPFLTRHTISGYAFFK